MDIGKFYGFTAPLSVTSDIALNRFKSMCKLLNNPVDFWILKDYINELKYLDRVLATNVISEYSDAQDRKLASLIKQSRHFFDTGEKLRSTLLTREELVDAEEYIQKRPKQVLNRMKVGEEFINLSLEETEILSKIYAKRPNIKFYINHVQINTFTEINVFGEKLYSILNWSPTYLYLKVQSMFKKAKNSKSILEKTLVQCKHDAEIMKSCFSDNVQDGFVKYLSSETPYELFKGLVQKNVLKDTDKELFSFLVDKGLLSRLTLDDLKLLTLVYRDVADINVEFFNREFGLDLAEQEYEKIFEKFNDLGIIGLNFYAKKFFNLMLDSVSFGEERKIIIPSDSELATVVREIDLLCDSELMHVGDDIA